MTVDNNGIEMGTAYKSKRFSVLGLFAVLGILLSIAVTFVIRDIGMIYVYGSIFTNISEANAGVEGAKATISLWSYLLTALLFILPLVIPFIYRVTGIAYDEEVASPLFPSVNKVLAVFMFLFIGAAMIIPVVLCMVGLFTYTYLFVAFNLLLVVMTNVTVFYYFGTYMLQRLGAPIGLKYSLPTVFMVLVNGLSIGSSFLFVKVLSIFDKAPALVAQLEGFKETYYGEGSPIVIWAIIMLVVLGSCMLISGLLYNMTQNIIYSSVPTFILAFAEISIFQRIKDITNLLMTTEVKIAGHEAKIAEAEEMLKTPNLTEAKIKNLQRTITTNTNSILELEEQLPTERVALVVCYIIVAIILLLMFIVFVRAIVGLISNIVETVRLNKKNKNA